MKPFWKFLLVVFIYSCNNKEGNKVRPFDSFVFSYQSESLAYSMKFSTNDTVFFVANFPERGRKYLSIINEEQRHSLDSFLNTNLLSNYDTTYIDKGLQDGPGYKFYQTKNTETKWVYIYGYSGPKELYTFAKYLDSLKDRLKFVPYDGKVDFGDLKYIQLPIVPPPPKKDGQ